MSGEVYECVLIHGIGRIPKYDEVIVNLSNGIIRDCNARHAHVAYTHVS